MTRQSFFFDCKGSQCAATLDLPPDGMETHSTGLLIVTGGNELRSGPHGSQATMAAHFAARGFPVFRYDRRGVGDSDGENKGWRGAEADMAAATAAFRSACANLQHIIGYGNCDGASSVALYGRGVGLSRAILANPWAFDHDGESSSNAESAEARPEHSRASTLRYYRQRLANPVSLLRDLIWGRINIGQTLGDVVTVGKAPLPQHTAKLISKSIYDWGKNAAIVLAKDDRTALHFQEQMDTLGHSIANVQLCPTASHSFAEDSARAWLYDRIAVVLNAP